jgi:hypothetical protein
VTGIIMNEQDYWMNRANQDTVNNNLITEAQMNYWAMKQDMVIVESLKPRLLIDGNQWCCMYGDNLQDGVAGFGDSPHAAIMAFNKEMYSKL